MQVEDALSDESRERRSLADLKAQLTELQGELQSAHDRMHQTQARVEMNVRRIEELRREAAALEQQRRLAQQQMAADRAATATAEAPAPAAARPSSGSASRKRSKGLESSLNLEPQLKEFWYPVEFSKNLKPDTLIPVELFGLPWVLFRDKDGRQADSRPNMLPLLPSY